MTVDFDVPLPEELSVTENEPITLTVTLSNNTPVTWTRNDESISLDDLHYSITHTGSTHTLTISKATLDDSAKYSLIAGGQKTEVVVNVKGVQSYYNAFHFC